LLDKFEPRALARASLSTAIRPPGTVVVASAAPNMRQPAALDLDALIYAADALRLRERLAAETRPSIPWSTFLRLCEDMHISPARAVCLANDLQTTGELLHSPQDGGTVCIRPREVLASSFGTKATEILVGPTDSYVEQRAALDALDAEARAGASRLMWAGGAYLFVQSAVLFRLTYWDLGWDAVEPASYFINVLTMLGWYAFAVGVKKEAAYMNADNWLFQKLRARAYRSQGLRPPR
jgi:hypothetical protein